MSVVSQSILRAAFYLYQNDTGNPPLSQLVGNKWYHGFIPENESPPAISVTLRSLEDLYYVPGSGSSPLVSSGKAVLRVRLFSAKNRNYDEIIDMVDRLCLLMSPKTVNTSVFRGTPGSIVPAPTDYDITFLRQSIAEDPTDLLTSYSVLFGVTFDIR